MAARDAAKRQLEVLKAELAALKAARRRREPENIEEVLWARLDEWKLEQERYAALPTAEKIAIQEAKYAETADSEKPERWVERESQLHATRWAILCLQEGVRMYPEPGYNEDSGRSATLWEKAGRMVRGEPEPAATEPPVRISSPSEGRPARQRRENVVDFDDYRPRDGLKDFRHQGRSPSEPEFT